MAVMEACATRQHAASKSTHNGKPCRKTEVRRAIKAEYRAKLKELEKATA